MYINNLLDICINKIWKYSIKINKDEKTLGIILLPILILFLSVVRTAHLSGLIFRPHL